MSKKRSSTGITRYKQKKICERRRSFLNSGQKYAEDFGYRVGVVIMPNDNDGPIRMWDNGDNWTDFLADFNERIREGTQLIPCKLVSKAQAENESEGEDFSALLSQKSSTDPVGAQAEMKNVSDTNSDQVANDIVQVGDNISDCRVSGVAEGGALDPATIKAYHTLGYPIISMLSKGQIVPQSSSGQIQGDSPGPSSGKRVEPLWLDKRRLEPVSSDED